MKRDSLLASQSMDASNPKAESLFSNNPRVCRMQVLKSKDKFCRAQHATIAELAQFVQQKRVERRQVRLDFRGVMKLCDPSICVSQILPVEIVGVSKDKC